MEKVHGSSSHISWKENKLSFFSGGAKHEQFMLLFDVTKLTHLFNENFLNIEVVIYGEVAGGSMQKMSHTYGKELFFIVFDVTIGTNWLDVPNAEQVSNKLGLEFVPYRKISTDLSAIDAERDRDSEVAVRRGCGSQIREGVVLRPLVECTKNSGARIICKHKRSEFAEQTKPPKVVDPSKIEILKNANDIAEQWVTPMRLHHILDKNSDITGIEHTGKVISAMIIDVLRESEGEIIVSKEAKSAIGRKAAQLFKAELCSELKEI